MKKIFLSAFIISFSAWGGWYMTEREMEEATSTAKLHPYGSLCVRVSNKMFEGSGILILPDVVLTAAHVLGFEGGDQSGLSCGERCQNLEVFSEEGNLLPSVRKAYFNNESDLAFLVLEEEEGSYKQKVPMIKSERYEEIVKIFNISEGGNVPRLSGSFDGGMVATYLGFGDTLIPTPGMNRENLTEEYKSGFWAKATRDKKLRSGRVQLSQHFEKPNCFYAWTDLDQGPDLSNNYSAALQRDSGAPTFVEAVESDPQILGIVSSIIVPDALFPKKGRVVGTIFRPPQAKISLENNDTWWESFLRVKLD